MMLTETQIGQDKWIGWYLTSDQQKVLRMNRSEHGRCREGSVSVDYRFYDMLTGRPVSSGIKCFPPEELVEQLKEQVGEESGCGHISYKMCDLDKGRFCEMLEKTYFKDHPDLLSLANEQIWKHFC